MSSNAANNSNNNGGAMTPADYAKVTAEIEAQEKNNEALLKQEQELIKEIQHANDQIYDDQQWLKDHDHWYDKIASWFTGARDEHEDDENYWKGVLKGLEKQLDGVEKQISHMDAELAAPIAMINLQVQQLFKQIGNGTHISQGLLQDVMAVMAEIMALVQVILAKTDDKKGTDDSRISKLQGVEFKENISHTQSQIKELIDAEHTAAIMKIVGDVFKAVIIVASVIIAAATGGACAFLVAVAVGVLMATGVTDDLANALAKATGSKILGDVLATAIIIVGTLGLGAATAGLEAGIESVLANVVSDVADAAAEQAGKGVVTAIVEEVLENVVEDAVDGISDSASSAAKEAAESVAGSVSKEAAQVAVRNAISSVLRQSLVKTVGTGFNASIKEAVETAVKEAVETAVKDASMEIANAAQVAVQNATGEVSDEAAETVIESLTKEAVENTTAQATKTAVSNLTLKEVAIDVAKQGIKTGTLVGVAGTNMVPDLVGWIALSIAELSGDKDAKKQEWYKILMDIVNVLNVLLQFVAMAGAGGMAGAGAAEGETATSENILKAMSKLEGFGRGLQAFGMFSGGVTAFAQGQVEMNQVEPTKALGKDKEATTILDYLMSQLNSMVQEQQKFQSKEMKDETNSSLETLNKLNQGAQGYANVLESTAV